MPNIIYSSKKREMNRLMSFYSLTKRRFKPTRTITSRRSAKAKSTATGQILKSSRVSSEVSLEAIFNHPSWNK